MTRTIRIFLFIIFSSILITGLLAACGDSDDDSQSDGDQLPTDGDEPVLDGDDPLPADGDEEEEEPKPTDGDTESEDEIPTDGDGEVEETPPPDGDTELEEESALDCDIEIETDDVDNIENTDGDIEIEQETGLIWENPPSEDKMTWYAAKIYCENKGMRLPTVSEARSLVRGCASIEPGGACGVHDGCIEFACWTQACAACQSDGGPDGGCYRPSEMEGVCGWTWTASSFEHQTVQKAWAVLYHYGNIDSHTKTEDIYVRCVGDPL